MKLAPAAPWPRQCRQMRVIPCYSMLHTTQGIVLSHIKYKESSIIAKIFTEALGLQTYLIQGVRAKKPKHNVALFQPLTLLDMVVYYKRQRGMQRIAEVQRCSANSNILADVNKGVIAIFIAEFLTKVIREEENNMGLFNFLKQAVIRLNEQDGDHEAFYLTFMLQLSHHLGFGISTIQDMRKQLRRSGQHWEIDQQVLEELNTLLKPSSRASDRRVKMDKMVKRRATEVIIKFYQLQIESLDTLKSLKVLQAIS